MGKVLKILSKLENISCYDFINYIDLASVDERSGLIQEYKRLTSEDIPSRARQKIEKGDLLIASLKGSLKSIAVYGGNLENAIASTGFFIIKETDNYNNFYLWALFRTYIYQKLLECVTTGAIMSAINRQELENLEIPSPSIEIQNKIAKEVKSRREKTKKLQQEAKELLEEAKNKVEKMILGRI